MRQQAAPTADEAYADLVFIFDDQNRVALPLMSTAPDAEHTNNSNNKSVTPVICEREHGRRTSERFYVVSYEIVSLNEYFWFVDQRLWREKQKLNNAKEVVRGCFLISNMWTQNPVHSRFEPS